MPRAATRRLLARAAASGVTALVAVVAVAGSAAAAASGSIDDYAPNPDGTVAIAFRASGLTAGRSMDPSTVKVTIDGKDVVATAVPLDQGSVLRTSYLVMDVSGSMQTKLADAKAAAEAYVQTSPADVRVGLIAFDTTAKVVLPPTTDRAQLTTAIGSLATNNGDTALNDAVGLATDELGTAGLRYMLVLSDGEDTASTSTEASVVAKIKASDGVVVDAVSLGATNAAQQAALTRYVQAGTGGQLVPVAAATDLAAAFTSVAQSQVNSLLVTAEVPASARGGSATVTVTAQAGDQVVSDSRAMALPALSDQPAPSSTAPASPVALPPVDPGVFGESWLLPVALTLLGIGLFALLAIAFLSTDRESQTSGRVRRRLARYSLTPKQETRGALGDSGVARSAVEFAGRVVQQRDIGTGLATKLEAAGVPLRPAEWLLLHIGIAAGAAILFTLLSGFSLLATLIGLVLGLLGPYAYLAVKEERRKSKFAEQLPGTLQLLSGSLAAGYSLPQAIDTVVRESSEPMASELNRAIVETRLGVPVEDALETVARRMNSVDFAWVVMAIRIQREVGGNLSEVLSNVAATMRERERLRRQVQVLSAEGRLSAVILASLPILFIVYLVIARPEYLATLYTTPVGLLMIVVGLVLLIGGIFWLRKVVKVEV